jgi:hypothetical protein
MSLTVEKSMLDKMGEVIAMLPPSDIKKTIEQTIMSKADKFARIEAIFRKIGSQKYSSETMSFFLNGWKMTHLKMLPIYGVSCRLNTLGMECGDEKKRLSYLESSAFNAQTSHEDLGLGFDAISHGRLYDEFAFSLTKSDEWKLSKYDTQKANDFSQWVYRGMLLNPIPYALCINMISEFYNHAEYAYAYETFNYSMSNFYGMVGKELEDAIRYIDVHNEYETEIHHFMAVINSIEKYEEASGDKVETLTMEEVIVTYVDSITDALESIARHFD